jgi:hypothetical protein
MNKISLLKNLVIQIRKILATLTKLFNKKLIQVKDLHEKDLLYSTKFYEHEDKTLTRFDNAYFLYLDQKFKDQKYGDKTEDLK